MSPSSGRWRLRHLTRRVSRTDAVLDSGSDWSPPAADSTRDAGGLDWARRIELASVVLASLVAVVGLWYSNIQTRQDRALSKEGQITDRWPVRTSVTRTGVARICEA